MRPVATTPWPSRKRSGGMPAKTTGRVAVPSVTAKRTSPPSRATEPAETRPPRRNRSPARGGSLTTCDGLRKNSMPSRIAVPTRAVAATSSAAPRMTSWMRRRFFRPVAMVPSRSAAFRPTDLVERRVELGPEYNGGPGQVEEHQRDDHPGEGAVGDGVVRAEAQVEREARGEGHPEDGGDEHAGPEPGGPGAATGQGPVHHHEE